MSGRKQLPQDPETRLQGTIKYQPNKGITLETLGFFGNISSTIKLPEYEIILGVNLSNKPITLVNCFQTGMPMRFPGFSEGIYCANLLLIGKHFNNCKEILFNEIHAHYAYLDEWVNIYGFNINTDKKDSIAFSINYTFPHTIVADINDDCSVSIYFTCDFHVPFIVKKELHPKQKTFFKIKFSEPHHYEEILNFQQIFQDFLTLATGERSFPLEVFGINKENRDRIDLYYNPISKIDTQKEIFPHNMLFTYPDISESFEAILKNWFEKAEVLQPVYILYFATRYHPFLYLENQFLNLIQALETYHSRVCDERYIPEEIYQGVYDRLIKAIPDHSCPEYSDFKDSLKGRLRYINEYSLRKRMKLLLRNIHIVFQFFVENPDDFIDKVVDTRNYLTHYSRNAELSIVRGDDLIPLTERVKILVEIILMRELGFSFDQIDGIIHGKRYFSHYFV